MRTSGSFGSVGRPRSCWRAPVGCFLTLHGGGGAGRDPPRSRDEDRRLRHCLGAQGRVARKGLGRSGTGAAGAAGCSAQAGRETRQVVSDDQGCFSVEPVHGGACHVVSADAASVCRCWAANTAPPSAAEQLTLVSQQRVERGQSPVHELYTPILVSLVVAAAIAIPLAVHNAEKAVLPEAKG